ncbi:MAG TPA: hypothetical protein VN253_25490, partial [Kofleriaceae bacterium]|nr:hypothetical protein [Kofleriaceae bacterium]
MTRRIAVISGDRWYGVEMIARRIVAVAAALACAGGCAAGPRARLDWPDAPVMLRDDADRAAAIDRLWATPPGPERDRARARIADAIARRTVDALDDDRPFAAAALFDQLISLWQADPEAAGRGLAEHAALLRSLRARFARSGALEPAVRALVVLAETDPDRRAAHLAELEEVLEFADQLAVAEYGPDARRAQPLALLGPAATALPLPWLVDRYVALLVERQVTVAGLLAAHGASLSLVRAHADVLSTSRRIAI